MLLSMRRSPAVVSWCLLLATGHGVGCGGSVAPAADGATAVDRSEPGRNDVAGFDASEFDSGNEGPDGDLPAVDSGPGSDSAVPVDTRPNIVVIMDDDLDVDSLDTLLAHGWAPNIQRYLVRTGLTFTHLFASNPQCCPSRATFLSGQYSHNNGVVRNGAPGGGFEAFRDGSTIGTWMHGAGYRTGFVGKYLNGYGEGSGAGTYVPPGWDDWQGLTQGTYHMWDYTVNDNGTPRHYGTAPNEYQTDVLATRASQFITESHARDANQPFFLVVTPVAPHGEIGVTAPGYNGGVRPPARYAGSVTLPLPMERSFNEADITDKPAFVRRTQLSAAQIDQMQQRYRQRLAAARAVDDLVGTVAAALERTGELGNTVLVFTSDNGYLLGEHRWQGKMVPWEDSIRLPLYVRMPGNSTARTVRQMVLNTDFAPTFVDLARGTTTGHAVDGRSIVPLLRGQSPAVWRDRVLLEHGASADDDDNADQVPDYTAVRTAPTAAQQANRLYARYESGDREFYDMTDDPQQLVSRHDATGVATALDRMNTWRMQLKTCAGASCVSAENP